MKQWITAAFLILLCGRVTARADTPPPALTNLAQIHKLTNTEAARHVPVDFEATVTYFRGYERTLFVQDGESAIYVQAVAGSKLVPGDRVRVRGTTRESFRPFVMSSEITRVGRGALPPAPLATFDDLIHARYDCMRVTVRALVRTADVLNLAARNASLQLVAEGGYINVTADTDDAPRLREMLDAEVEITGTASGRFDGKMQQTGVLLHVSSIQDIRVIRPAGVDPWTMPLTPMDQVLTKYHVNYLTGRTRVKGTVTYYLPGSGVVLQDGIRSLWIATETRNDLAIGHVADATGIPGVRDGFLTLTLGEFRDSGISAPVSPRPSTWNELSASHQIFDLVSVRAQVVMEAREASQDRYILFAEGQLFSAILRHPAATSRATSAPLLPPMKHIPAGSTVQVTGICMQSDANPFDANVPFDLIMRDFNDIAVVARPPWMNVRNLTIVAGAFLLFMILLGIRAWSLEHRIRRQNAVAADVERLRSSVLEDINRARPIADIITRITELLSFKLQQAPCWCELEGGTTVGKHPAAGQRTEMIEHQILSHSGKRLGTIYAGILPDSGLRKIGPEALFNAAQLAALAIETGGLYSDLVYRSQFDQLTDIHNRFALGNRLDTMIEAAGRADRSFGLIYVDLDNFKLVNDRYGHRVGDLYLQETARRMKRLLRPHDMLARLGGDEFAVVISTVHSRAELEEITARLERCFDEPLTLEGNVLQGTASVGIALFPEDGDTQDALLSAADSAMYKVKHSRHEAMGMQQV